MVETGIAADTVQDWLEVLNSGAPKLGSAAWGEERLKRLHGQQMALDVIAHVQNLPLRLLRLDNLVHLDRTFERFVDKWHKELLLLFTETSPDGGARVPAALSKREAEALLGEMRNPHHLRALRKWVLDLADTSKPLAGLRREDFVPKHYAEWFLALLPHLERDVWLTEMGNPLPAHNLARMVEHCSLYILMWAWSRADWMAQQVQAVPAATPLEIDQVPLLSEALGIKHLGICVLPAYRRRGENGLDVVLIAGPFLLNTVENEPAERADDGHWFVRPVLDYLDRVRRVSGVEGWDEVSEKAPGATELLDAMESRAALDPTDARQRCLQGRDALRRLLAATLDASLLRWQGVQGERPLSRANWETMAALAGWYERWGDAAEKALHEQSPGPFSLLVRIGRHRVRSLVYGEAQQRRLHFFAYDAPVVSPADGSAAVALDGLLAEANSVPAKRWIEAPAAFFARMRERQNAAWTAHVAAVNYLLARHSRRDRPEGADDPEERLHAPPTCDETDHLLRGFGVRVCRYLLSLARADIAEIYWLDYSSDPPRLRPVGSAERLIQHRARRQELLSGYEQRIWIDSAPAGEPATREGIDLGPASPFQMYRAVATAQVQPTPQARKAALASKAQSPGFVWPTDEDGRPEPADAVSVPLLFNDRVVGLFALAGIANSRHFDLRLYPAFRLVAQVLAQAMYFHSQVWHMRQLNWLASQVPLHEWRRHEEGNRFNPMERVARCLANIFLCDAVQIWLVDPQNPKRFLLHGNTAPKLFDEDGLPPEHAPHLNLQPVDDDAQPVDPARSFIAFAIDQWRHEQRAASAAIDDAAGATAQHRGRFVQAQYVGGGGQTVDYTLRGAERGDLVLRRDFVAAANTGPGCGDATSGLRKQVYEVRKWVQTMAFALVSGPAQRQQVVGVVAGFAGGVRNDGANGRTDACDGAKPARPPWPPGWRPVVAHVQSYLPYLLMQTEAVANPINNMHRYLLHEGRNELNAASEQASQLRLALQQLLAVDAAPNQFRARPWLRQWQDPPAQPGAASLPTDLLRGLQQIDTSLAEVAAKAASLMSVERGDNMAMLGRLIERRREIATLGLDFGKGGRFHDMLWLPLRAVVRELFDAYADDLRKQRVWWSADKLPALVQVLMQPNLWKWMLGDLVHNLVKYANPNSGAEAIWIAPSDKRGDEPYRLRLRNESSFDPELDQPDRLVAHGVQGSAGRQRREQVVHHTSVSRVGEGIGLWGVNLLAEAMHLRLDIQIQPRRNPREANYLFDLVIPPHLVRRGAGKEMA